MYCPDIALPSQAVAVASPAMIRFGHMTENKFFVRYGLGVRITSLSTTTKPLVLLKRFNPGHPGVPSL